MKGTWTQMGEGEINYWVRKSKLSKVLEDL